MSSSDILLAKRLSSGQKRLIAVALLGGSVAAGANALQTAMRAAAKEQRAIAAEFEEGQPQSARRPQRKPGVAVDALFAKRVAAILRICVPSIFSVEAGLFALQGAILVSRTLLTDFISRIEARSGTYIIRKEFNKFTKLMLLSVGLAIPTAIVNSGIKYLQTRIQLSFVKRLTVHLHEKYTSNRAYYAASHLGGLTHADQRITEDVDKFATSVADLYSYTLKPLLDVLLFTRSLGRLMGYKSQAALYLYYFAMANGLRALSPKLALMTWQESQLSGSFRSAHQRLVASAEEVAFNDPPSGQAERMILNQHLARLLRYTRASAFQRFVQGCFDGLLIKYGATIVALGCYAAPIYFRNNESSSAAESTADYLRSMRLLQNTSKGVGDLVLVYKRVTALAGHTARVSELLEAMQTLSGGSKANAANTAEAQHRELYIRNVSMRPERMGRLAGSRTQSRLSDATIRFDRVAVYAPDGTCLVRELTLDLRRGHSVIIMGPNGSGKSSLFRVLAGLWPLQGGEITVPRQREVFYLSQRPYLVSGSLRDQLRYPRPPTAVWAASSQRDRDHFACQLGPGAGQDLDTLDPAEEEARLEACLRAVQLDYLLQRGKGWSQVRPWKETLSGGEQQRLAMARLLFHAPTYAILDECTSAVSADGEVTLYQACVEAGITLLSIGHRPAIKAFHQSVLHFEPGIGNGWRLEELSSVPEGMEGESSAGGSNVVHDVDEEARDAADGATSEGSVEAAEEQQQGGSNASANSVA